MIHQEECYFLIVSLHRNTKNLGNLLNLIFYVTETSKRQSKKRGKKKKKLNKFPFQYNFFLLSMLFSLKWKGKVLSLYTILHISDGFFSYKNLFYTILCWGCSYIVSFSLLFPQKNVDKKCGLIFNLNSI